MAEVSGLDGLGFLAGVAPVPTAFAIVKAQVKTPSGIETQYVLVVTTPSGANVTYWSRESLQLLADQCSEAITGIEVARGNGLHVHGGAVRRG